MILDPAGWTAPDGARASRATPYFSSSAPLESTWKPRSCKRVIAGIGLIEAEDQHRFFAALKGKGVHVLDVDGGANKGFEDIGQAAGMVRHFDGQHLGDLHHRTGSLEQILGPAPVRDDHAQDAKSLSIGQSQRLDIDAFARQQAAGGDHVARLVFGKNGKLVKFHACTVRRSITRRAFPSLR